MIHVPPKFFSSFSSIQLSMFYWAFWELYTANKKCSRNHYGKRFIRCYCRWRNFNIASLTYRGEGIFIIRTYLLWWWVWVNKEKQKHKSIYVGVAALRSALVEHGQSLRLVKCFPAIKHNEKKGKWL